MAETLSKQKLMRARKGALWQERDSWMEQWRDISSFLIPRSGRFFLEDRNVGRSGRWNDIKDSTGTRAHRILAAGLMSGMTSPARPWVRLGTMDPELMLKSSSTRLWLSQATRLMLDIFARSNTYRTLHTMYEELGAFGTGVAMVLDDFHNVIHTQPLTCGEFSIAADSKQRVNTVYREFQNTVGQIVGEFGRGNCSDAVKNLFDRGQLDVWVPITHAIEPRKDRDASIKTAANKAYASCYFESGANDDTYLRESGFDEFPALAPRWALSGGDLYGTSPAMESLGDVMQLQYEQLRKAQAIDYQTKPPLQLPVSLKMGGSDLLPGGTSYVDQANPSGGIRTAFDVKLDLSTLLEDIRDVRERINSSFYADVFAMMLQDDRSGTTAREIAERHEEKLLLLGPVLERLHNELLSPLIEITFSRMVKAGILPPIPPDMQGQELNVEFVSVLAQAQRAVGISAVDRLLGTVGQMASFKPEVLDKLDGDKTVDMYADMLGVDPSLIVSDEKIVLIRDARAKQQQQAHAMEQAQAASATAKNVSQINPDTAQTLTDNLRERMGYGGAAV